MLSCLLKPHPYPLSYPYFHHARTHQEHHILALLAGEQRALSLLSGEGVLKSVLLIAFCIAFLLSSDFLTLPCFVNNPNRNKYTLMCILMPRVIKKKVE